MKSISSSSNPAAALPVRCEDACARSGAPHAALLQLLALSTMLVDHLGAVSILGDWSRLVGRFALPAFVVMIAFNALRARSPRVMAVRCLLLLLISQPLWWLSVGSWERLCIMVTLWFCVLLVWCWRDRHYLEGVIVLGAFLLISPLVEYGPWPLLLLPLVLAPSPWSVLCALVWPLVQYHSAPVFQVSALVALVVILLLLRFPFNVPRLPRLLTRWFYPAHLAALVPFAM